MKKLRILVLFGGASPEHEVSIRSASTIVSALSRDTYTVLPVALTKTNFLVSVKEHDLDTIAHEIFSTGHIADHLLQDTVSIGQITALSPDIVIPMIHGAYGEDGKIQGFLDMLGIPYVGAQVLGSSIGMDKEIQKIIALHHHINVAPFRVLHRHEWATSPKEQLQSIISKLAFPLFVKPANAGSSVGITKVSDSQGIEAAITNAFQFDSKCIVETGIQDAREIESAVIGNELPEVAEAFSEIIPDREFYDYDAKYAPDSQSQVIIPAHLTSEEREKLQKIAATIYTALQCRGFARVDMFMTREGVVYFNEINTLPGFTSISAFAKMWQASGVPYSKLLDKIISLAIQ